MVELFESHLGRSNTQAGGTFSMSESIDNIMVMLQAMYKEQ